MINLNLGCGNDIQKDFINIDIRPTGDVIADVLALPFKPETVDTIKAIDIFEHISFTKSKELLIHWVSLLKPNGQIYIQSPSIDRIIQYYQETGHKTIEGIETTIACLFGAQDYHENTHYTICNPMLMDHYLREAGIKQDIQYRLSNTNIEFRAIK